jgi:squalene-hopene/tetraprenyl-beta-curcumene cyclase
MAELEKRYRELTQELRRRMNPEGFWTGELSSSALGVAVAVAALHFDDHLQNCSEISSGLDWLTKNINADGSYGDTPESPGNISTTLLVYAAVNLYASADANLTRLQISMAGYLAKNEIDLSSDRVSTAILNHYRKDYTFSVPILTLCALCGIPGQNAFDPIPQLPFELSLLPRKFYRLLNLSVVSYAIPALVAVGIVIFKKKKSNFLWDWIRRRSVKKALAVLHKMLPESGGFLEAIPLTAFVSLSLIHAGYKDSDIVRKGIGFLKNTQRENGSWPIDVDLSTWVTTLGIKSLRSKKDEILTPAEQERLASHLISIQNQSVHPFNGTAPGGWGWTSYPGSVPDCDDTPGVVLALLQLRPAEQVKKEVLAGCNWLFSLQNKDGGFPTFTKGWGKLPFDRSCADLTAHCLLALSAAFHHYGNGITSTEKLRFKKTIRKAAGYLHKNQLPDGSWQPLWFGNQLTPNHTNPVYGTARVVTYLQDLPMKSNEMEKIRPMVDAGTAFLLLAQREDGSWGGNRSVPGTIEETALAVSALIPSGNAASIQKGLTWLDNFTGREGVKASAIGLYFASLWYDEKMYPLTAYIDAITRAMEAQKQ